MIAVFCIAMLGWSQFAVASYVCPQDLQEMQSLQGMQPDCQEGMHQKPSSLCKVHCEKSSPSPQAPDMAAPVLALLCTAGFLDVPGQEASGASVPYLRTPPGAPPPLRIQYQVFRI